MFSVFFLVYCLVQVHTRHNRIYQISQVCRLSIQSSRISVRARLQPTDGHQKFVCRQEHGLCKRKEHVGRLAQLVERTLCT